MAFMRGFNVVFGQADLTDKLFEEIPKMTKREANIHWWRYSPVQWLPNIPNELTNDPVRLKRIIFHYEDLQKLRDIGKQILSKQCRLRRDSIIVDRPSIGTKGLTALLAVLAEYGNSGNTAVLILPEQADLKLTATLYTRNLWAFNYTSGLQPLLS